MFTENNHYNPCFWSAYWNKEYLDYIESGEDSKLKKKIREYTVYCLNFKANKIIVDKVNNIFFEKGTNISVINEDNSLIFSKRNFSKEYENIKEFYGENPDAMYVLDSENFFTGIENNVKDAIARTIFHGTIKNVIDKTMLSIFIYLQYTRNPAVLMPFLEVYQRNGRSKFEFFWEWRHMLTNSYSLFDLVLPMVTSRWTLYKFDKGLIPLSDHPVIKLKHKTIFPLSPKMLIEIDYKIKEDRMCVVKKSMSFFKFQYTKRLIIKQIYNQVVFLDMEIAKKWYSFRKIRKRLRK